ncbi:nucleotide sugar dehydrogenase [Chloroflexia bacterium SDU3-3]|nr:nucleotide sugar dehydrogenase [Chloroflexia bacterium SDU3-3]
MSVFESLLDAISTRTATIGIIGLGYVGLPLAARAGRVGFRVLGFDVSQAKIDLINGGGSDVGDVPASEIAALRAQGRIEATTDMARLAQCDAIIICVPTPLNKTRDPDMRYIEHAADDIAAAVRPGQLVVLESTTWPGTTEEVLMPRMVRPGITVGETFFLAFSPERIDPGQVSSKGYTVENTPKVVGGVTPRCSELAAAFYSQITTTVVPVSSPRVAELTKLFENVFRNVNIALVNELALLCDRMGVSPWEVIDAAATKPFGFMKFSPGPGWGGHCIPIDPFYLTWKAREFDFSTRFTELAGEINAEMPRHVRELVVRALNAQGKALRGASIVLLGVAYKPDVADYRESPVFKVMDLLEHDGARLAMVDPFVDEFIAHDGKAHHTVRLTDELLASADCAVIITNHSAFEYERIVSLSRAVVDTRNATKAVAQGREKITLL